MIDLPRLAEVQRNMSLVEELQRRLTEFNVFSLLGTSHLELAHTRVLAFLFDPRGQHGFGTAFGSRFLRLATEDNDPALVARLLGEPLSWVFDPTVVLREEQSIDLRVIDPDNRIVLVIENKVHSSEHDDQLQRYWLRVQDQYPPSEWRIVPLYLTLAGERPSHPDYLYCSYRIVSRVIGELLAASSSFGSDAVSMTLTHYQRMIQRELVGDWDLAAKAKQLYDSAPQAFDFIVEHKHYPRAEMRSLLSSLVSNTPPLVIEPEEDVNKGYGVAYLRFSHPVFDHLEAADRLTREKQWTNSRRMLLFQFDIKDREVVLGLFVGPGPELERQKLISIAERYGQPFDLSLWQGYGKRRWRKVYEHEFANERDFDDLQFEILSQTLRERWLEFVSTELDRVIAPFVNAVGRP